jgi:hypothetical protein
VDRPSTESEGRPEGERVFQSAVSAVAAVRQKQRNLKFTGCKPVTPKPRVGLLTEKLIFKS